MTASREQFSSVFGNHLISERILHNLNYTDHRSLKQVSPETYEIVKNSRVYQNFILNAQILEVTEENVIKAAEYFSPANILGKAWRGVKIDVDIGAMIGIEDPTHEDYVGFDVIDTIKDILELSASVSFYTALGLARHLDPPDSQMQFMVDILSLAKTMEKLALSLGLLWDYPVFENIWKSPDAVANLKSLKSLEFQEYDERFGGLLDDHSYFTSSYVTQRYADCEESNFKFLAMVPFQNLATFRVSKSLVVLENELKPDSIGYIKYIPGILRSNRETLEDIAIHFKVWENEDMGTVTLPKLKSLTVTLYTKGQETMARFLDSNPTLEELDVDLRQENDKENFFSSSLFDAIKRRSQKLKKLHLKTRKFDGGKVDWTFLKEMVNLRDFCVVHRSSRENSVPVTSLEAEAFGTGPRFLELLPKNQLERLSLNGFYREVGFWNISSSGDDLTYKLNLLESFRNLKRLRLFACRNSLNDDVMQFILREMKCLEELEVSHCNYLTDAGITGKPPSASIRNLKALKILTIAACPFVTSAGVLSSVKHPFLQHLKYVTDAELPITFFVEIARQNPRLVGIHCNYDIDAEVQPLDALRTLGHAHLKFVEYEIPEFLTDAEGDRVSESDPEEEPESDDGEGEISEDEEDEGHVEGVESEDEVD